DAERPLSVGNVRAAEPLPAIEGPTVSVAMSCFNAAMTLAPAMESVLAQSYRSIELLVVDDCSTDDSVAIAEQIAARDDRVRVVRMDRNGGTYAARNRALELATGEFFVCNDADDFAHPQRIEHLVAALAGRPEAIAARAQLYRLNEVFGIKM